MNNRDTIIAYLEDTLSMQERERFEVELAESQELSRELEQYRQLFAMEQELANVEAEIGPDFTVRVMDSIENGSSLARFFERYMQMSRKVLMPAVGLAVVVLCVMVAKDVNESGVEFDKIGESLSRVPAVETSVSDIGVVGDREQSGLRTQELKKESSEALVDELEAPKDQDKFQANSSGSSLSGLRNELDSKGQEQFQGGGQIGSLAKSSVAPKAKSRSAKPSVIPGQIRDRVFQRKAEVLGRSQEESALVASGSADASIGKSVREGVSQPTLSPAPGVKGSERKVNPRVSDLIAAPVPGRIMDQGPARGEGYGMYLENPRISVAQQPVSTFSLDVDTGSYTNARRFLNMGQLPPRESVRLEEFVNYFDYNYPDSLEKPFSVHYEIAPSPFSNGRHLIKLGVKARDIASDRLTPWNLVFLVDVSGSMNQANKLPLVQASLKYLVSQMKPQDRIAIVTYAGNTRLLLDSTSAANKKLILNQIDLLSAGGGTNGSGGIQLAYQIAAKNRIPGGVNRVILATDGDFNVGIRDFNGLMRLIEAKRREGTTLTSLGFGVGNYQERNLEQLANRGNGNYFYIDSFAEAKRIFGEDLAATLQVVAKDVKVQIEFNPANVIEYRLVGYDNRRLRNQDFNNDAVDAGDIGSGHTVTAFYEVVLADSHLGKQLKQPMRYKENSAQELGDARSNEIGFVKLRYKAPNSDTSTLENFELRAERVSDSFAATTSDFKFATAVVGFGQILRGSQFIDGATLDSIEEIARNNAGDDQKRREFISLVGLARAVAPGLSQR